MNFPTSTLFNQKLSKQNFYENLSATNAIKKMFVEQIDSIYWQYKFSADTINLSSSNEVIEIEILRLILRKETIDEEVLKIIDKGIPYHTVFILEYSNQIKLCVAYKEIDINGNCTLSSEYYYTNFNSEENIQFRMIGLSLKEVYENFIRQIADDKIIKKSNCIKTDIEETHRINKLQKEIERLEKMARNEKQPRKKFELVQKINDLKKCLKSTI